MVDIRKESWHKCRSLGNPKSLPQKIIHGPLGGGGFSSVGTIIFTATRCPFGCAMRAADARGNAMGKR
jgi:hypothetical protein